jgi:hypothetical protein
MRIVELMPGEANAGLISSIINLICPQCPRGNGGIPMRRQVPQKLAGGVGVGEPPTAYSAESGERERGGARGLR